MTLKLHLHPFASYCQKAVIAFYENGTPFEACLVDLGEEASRSAFLALWPMGKMPVLQDDARGVTRDEHHHRISGTALSWRGAPYSGRSRCGFADPSEGSDLRPVRPGTYAGDRG